MARHNHHKVHVGCTPRKYCRCFFNRHKKSTLDCIAKPALRRLARRGGVKRVSDDSYAEIRYCLKDFLVCICVVCDSGISCSCTEP